jgi:methyl-accepting chemotaxis protein
VAFPITAKLTAVAAFSLIFMTSIMFLVFLKDLYGFIDLEQDDYGRGGLLFLQELLFVGFVILVEMLNLIVSFCRNLKQFFHNQNASMEAVTKGNLDQHVIISSQDEFSVMGRYTNWMIEMLKKRNRELETARRNTATTKPECTSYACPTTARRWQGQSNSLKNNATSSCRPAPCTMWARSASVITSC